MSVIPVKVQRVSAWDVGAIAEAYNDLALHNQILHVTEGPGGTWLIFYRPLSGIAHDGSLNEASALPSGNITPRE